MKITRLNANGIITWIQYLQNTGNIPLIAMALLPYLVPDSRCKPELEKILQLTYVSHHLLNWNSCIYSILIGIRNNCHYHDYHNGRLQKFCLGILSLWKEDHLTKQLPIYLLAPYCIFNMCYPKGCNNFY